MPRILGESLREHRDLVQRRVFDAFAQLMAESSFERLTMAQLAQRAGLGRTAIYHHFPDKEAVVVAFATHETSAYVAHLREVLTQADTPTERLQVYVRENLDSGDEFHMGLGPSLAGLLSPDARLAIREHVRAVEDVLRDILKEGRRDGTFVYDEVADAMQLIHACLGPRHLPHSTIETFVLRALGAADRD